MRERCSTCRSTLSLGESNDRPGIVRVEIAAAGLIAGYLTANDTDVTLNDPIARMVLDWQLEEHGPMLAAVALCDALYVVAVNHHDRDQARGAA